MERAKIGEADHLERLQMTNPDERRSRVRVVAPAEQIVPLNYGAALAAQIPQVQMPADWDAPRQFGLPVVPPAPVLHRRGAPVMAMASGPVLASNIAATTTSPAASWMECIFGQSYSCGSTCTSAANKKGQRERKRKGSGTIASDFRWSGRSCT